MDQEIEDLLRSLDIDVSRATNKEPEATPKEELPKGSQKHPCRLFSWVGYLVMGLLSGLISLHTYHYLTKKKPNPPVRMVASPSCEGQSFFAKQGHSAVQYTFNGVPYALSKEEKTVPGCAQQNFYDIPSASEEKFVQNIRASQNALGQERQALSNVLFRARPLEERESIRTLARSFDSYLRSHMIASSELEGQLREQKPPLSYMNLFGGIPQEGCSDVVKASQRIEREMEQLFTKYSESQTAHDQALTAISIMKLLDRCASDKLLSVLVNVREGKKRLERVVQVSLERIRTSGGAIRSLQEVRALSLLETCLQKNEMMPWDSFEKELQLQTKKVDCSSFDALSLPATGPSTERIDWSYKMEYTGSLSE